MGKKSAKSWAKKLDKKIGKNVITQIVEDNFYLVIELTNLVEFMNVIE